MPLFIDGNGKTRLMDISKPYPQFVYFKKVRSLVPICNINFEKLPTPEEIQEQEAKFTLTTKDKSDIVIYECKEEVF